MIEVFRTNVKERDHANMLVDQIHKIFINYRANFDLDDCDHVLRVKSTTGIVESSCLVDLLMNFGFHAEVLPDIPPENAGLPGCRVLPEFPSSEYTVGSYAPVTNR